MKICMGIQKFNIDEKSTKKFIHSNIGMKIDKLFLNKKRYINLSNYSNPCRFHSLKHLKIDYQLSFSFLFLMNIYNSFLVDKKSDTLNTFKGF